jgi:hypothetical protein
MVPTKVNNRGGLYKVEFGLPFRFITQNDSNRSYGETSEDRPLPTRISILSPWENPTKFKLNNFLLSFATVLILTELIYLTYLNH